MGSNSLTSSELAIMDLLWNHEYLTAREIREELYGHSPTAQHGTVQRLLQRMEKKGFIEKDSSEFVHRFSALVKRSTYAGQQLESLASELTSGSIAPLITHLVETSKISKDDLQKIKTLLDASLKNEANNE